MNEWNTEVSYKSQTVTDNHQCYKQWHHLPFYLNVHRLIVFAIVYFVPTVGPGGLIPAIPVARDPIAVLLIKATR